MLLRIFLLIFLTSLNGFSVEEVQVRPPQKLKVGADSQEIESLATRRQSQMQISQSYENFLDLRHKKRLSIGLQTLGKAGLIAAQVELNLAPRHSAEIHFGGGPQFSAVGFSWKRYFGSRQLAPFFSLGISHWYNASERSISTTTPSYLGNTILTQEEKRTGEFALQVLHPSLGLNYFFIQGELSRSAIFGEISWLRPLDRSSQTAVAGFGYQYLF